MIKIAPNFHTRVTRDEIFVSCACNMYLFIDPATSHQIQNILITVNNGLQGCKYCHDKFQRDYGPWTAFRTLDYGYTRVQVFNSSHLYLEQVSIDQVSVTCRHNLLSFQHVKGAWQRFYERKFLDNLFIINYTLERLLVITLGQQYVYL